MTQEEKQLLLKDLCARLPYGVKCGVLTHPNNRLPNWKKEDDLYYKGRPNYQTLDLATLNVNPIECFVPYLRPLSSMTEEEEKEFEELFIGYSISRDRNCVYHSTRGDLSLEIIDWLNARHFDYRGLIPIGLALEAKEGMYKF